MTDERVCQLFADWEETLIWSCLQEKMGEIKTDNLASPKSAIAKIGRYGCFGFLAGKPDETLIKYYQGEDIILVPQDKGWSLLIENHYPGLGRVKKFLRYATKKDTKFDKLRLDSFVNNLSQKYKLIRINRDYYHKCLGEEWSRDLVANYKNYEDYEQNGLGYLILDGDKIISGASSFSYYDGGIEIEIDTRGAYRKQGLATIVAAKLILSCLEQNLYPSWDAHNLASLHLAEKLGYTFSHEYIAYEVNW